MQQLKSSILDLENRYSEACDSFWLEPSEDSQVLRSNILSLVKNIPARFTRIAAQLAKLRNTAKFYGLVAGDCSDETGKENFEGAIGLLRYLIAHGDTCIEKYQASLGKAQESHSDADLEKIERNKYLIYSNFDEYILRGYDQPDKIEESVIEIGWD